MEEKLVRDYSGEPKYRAILATWERDSPRLDMDRLADAERHLEKSLAADQGAGASTSGVPAYVFDLAGSYQSLGILFSRTDRLQKAVEAALQAVALYQQLCDAYPEVPLYQYNRARHHSTNLADLYRHLGQPTKAEQEVLHAITIQEKLVKAYPQDPVYQGDLAHACLSLALTYFYESRLAESEKRTLQARNLAKQLEAAYPKDAGHQVTLANCCLHLSYVYRDMEQPARAAKESEEGVAICRRLVEGDPGVPQFQMLSGNTLLGLGVARHRLGQLPEAAAALKEALAIWDGLARQVTTTYYRSGLGEAKLHFASVLRDQGKSKEALEKYNRAADVLETVHRFNRMIRRPSVSCTRPTRTSPDAGPDGTVSG